MPLFRYLDRRRAPAPEPEKVAWLKGYRYAHRGLHGPGFPENSFSAFDLAIQAGVGIECDVQRSGDGRAAVFHDWGLDRLTELKGPVVEMAMAELEQIPLRGSDPSVTRTGRPDHIPSLENTLKLVDGKVPLLIEIKSRRERRVSITCLAVMHALEGYQGRCAVMSFDPRVSRWFAGHAPHITRGLVVSEGDDYGLIGAWRRHRLLWAAKPDFLAYDVRDFPSRFAAAQRKRGLPVVTWTVSDEHKFALAEYYADAPIAEGAGLM